MCELRSWKWKIASNYIVGNRPEGLHEYSMSHQCNGTCNFTEVVLGLNNKKSKLHTVFLVLLDPCIIIPS